MAPPWHRRTALLSAALLGLLLLVPTAGVGRGSVVAGPGPDQAGDDQGSHDHGSHDHGSLDHAGAPGEGCPGEEYVIDGAVACLHLDEPPPGVDVTVPVSTAEALGREGAEPAAIAAAADEGVVTAATGDGSVSVEAGSQVPCDGDGVSGYRVQAMYVVPQGRRNRHAELLASMQTWAAGANTVINRSAALTGGVRDLRYVHAPGTGDCTPTVLNVTIPAGSEAGVQSSIDAVRALGYTSPRRKYLMWVDASVLCGVASMYEDDQPGQTNANNGYHPQYSRIDTACWGLPGSVEAHELVHNLGGVQPSARNATPYGHCTDESDRMCYVDGPGVVLRQVCPKPSEHLLDCNSDDYFSTLPPAGSYLATRWNTADSRFLIGGGNGTTGGQPGTAPLSVTVQLNTPAVPGLSTQASAVVQVPTGRTASVAWTTSRPDCRLGTAAAVQTSITCPATTTAPVTVTASVTDSTGGRATASTALTFSTARRDATVTFDVAGSTSGHVGCTGAVVPMTATVRDTVTGTAVLGVPVDVVRRNGTTGTTVASASTSETGQVVVRPALRSGAHSARTRTSGPFDRVTPSSDVPVTTRGCPSRIDLRASAGEAAAGGTVTFTGTARSFGPTGVASPVTGARLTLVQVRPGSGVPAVIGSTRTDATGAYSLPVVVRSSGAVRARLTSGDGRSASQSVAVPLVVVAGP